MTNLIDITSYFLIQKITLYFNDININFRIKKAKNNPKDTTLWVWDPLFIETKVHLKEILYTLDTFNKKLKDYYLSNGLKYDDSIDLQKYFKFHARVIEINDLRSQHDEILSLIGYNNNEKDNVNKGLDHFSKIKFLNTNENNTRWYEAKTK